MTFRIAYTADDGMVMPISPAGKIRVVSTPEQWESFERNGRQMTRLVAPATFRDETDEEWIGRVARAVPPLDNGDPRPYLVLDPADLPDDSLRAAWMIVDGQLIVDAARKLATLKAAKVAAIQARTRELCLAGFTFDNHTFSTSIEAQSNWQGLAILHATGQFADRHVSTSAGGEYEITTATIAGFLQAFTQHMAGAQDSGRALRLAALAATTIEELAAVVDNR